MRELYTTEYVEKYRKLKKRQVITYVVVCILALLLVVGIIIYYAFEPYKTKARIPLMIAMFLVIIAFVTYSFLHFQFIYGSVRKYFNFLLFSACGKRNVDKVTVLSVFSDTVDKSGIDCTRIVVLEWSDAQNDYVEHTIYVDNEVVVDDICEGDILTVATNSSYLLAYKKEN
ncbi:MAG: hypothetical protein IJA97_05595 [Clostridia bacterium]|nr:hypothetical protein [Clostridia bacterium]